MEGATLGEGGQGRVVVVTSHPGWAAKFLAAPLLDAESDFDDLVQTGRRVKQRLHGEPVEIVWPEWPIVDGRYLVGFLMPLVLPNAGYVVRIHGKLYQATLAHAVPRPGPMEPDMVPTPEQRRALLRALATFLSALHQEDHVYGDLSWQNCLFRLQPTPTVLPLDLDSVRRIGHATLHRVPDVNTVDWHDPHPGPELAGFDRDRYKFALMVYRMLITENLHAPLPDAASLTAHTGPSGGASPDIRRLLRRAATGPGGRPAMSEWVRVLT